MSKRKKTIIIDSALLVGAVASYASGEGPESLHAWISVVLAAIVAVHLWFHRRWISRAWRQRRKQRAGDRRLAVVNVILFSSFGVALATGFTSWLMDGLFEDLHEASSNFSVLVLVAHLATNWKRIRALLKRRGDTRRSEKHSNAGELVSA